jgi:hypothetical protein
MVIRALMVCLALAAPAAAQTPTVPDQAETARLVWSTLIALDQANRTGNYTVLRDLGAPGFREANTAADLAAIFANIRAQDPGLSRVLSQTPVYREPPRVAEDGRLYITGQFPGRPNGLGFELLFEPVGGEWRLFGIAVQPLAEATSVPAPAAP